MSACLPVSLSFYLSVCPSVCTYILIFNRFLLIFLFPIFLSLFSTLPLRHSFFLWVLLADVHKPTLHSCTQTEIALNADKAFIMHHFARESISAKLQECHLSPCAVGQRKVPTNGRVNYSRPTERTLVWSLNYTRLLGSCPLY